MKYYPPSNHIYYENSDTTTNKLNIKDNKIIDEIDTVIGKNHIGALVKLVDRTSKFTLIKKVNSKKASEVTKALIEMLYPIREITHTITSYNRKEFANHEEVRYKVLLCRSISFMRERIK